MSGAERHQQTLDAINSSNKEITNQVNNLSLAISNQSDYIESLERQVDQLSVALAEFQKEAMKEVQKKPEPIIIPTPPPAPESKQLVLGEIEEVTIDSIGHSFTARIDTGAATSSLNAIDIEEFERNGEEWVRFHLDTQTKQDEKQDWIEAPVVRHVKIRQSTNESMERRAVVELWIQVGNIKEKAQFTLADRSRMTHPILIGREFIRDIAVVDVSKKYIHKDGSDNPSKKR